MRDTNKTSRNKMHKGSYSLTSHYYIKYHFLPGAHAPRQSRFILENTTEALLVLEQTWHPPSPVAWRNATRATPGRGPNIVSRAPFPVPSHTTYHSSSRLEDHAEMTIVIVVNSKTLIMAQFPRAGERH